MTVANQLLLLLIAALLIESIWETAKMTWQEGKLQGDRVGALVVALLLAWAWPLDLFVLLGFPLAWSYLGIVLTGIMLSRGANWVHDLLARIAGLGEGATSSKL